MLRNEITDKTEIDEMQQLMDVLKIYYRTYASRGKCITYADVRKIMLVCKWFMSQVM